MITALIILNGLVLLLLAGVVYISFLERQKLLDRIMAKNYPEYIDNKKPEDNDFSDGTENIVDLEDAREEITK